MIYHEGDDEERHIVLLRLVCRITAEEQSDDLVENTEALRMEDANSAVLSGSFF